MLYWYKSTNTDAGAIAKGDYDWKDLLYWYKRTCFTGTKIQILTKKALLRATTTGKFFCFVVLQES